MRTGVRITRRIALAALAASLGTAAGAFLLRAEGQPTVAWRVDAAAVEPLAEVRAHAVVRCVLDLPRPAWAYAATHDPTRGCLALWPSDRLETNLPANPMPAGCHELPGRFLERALEWTVGDAVGPVSFLLVVSEQPLPELERRMAVLRQVGNAAFPNRPTLGPYAPREGMAAVPPRSEPPPVQLCAAWELQQLGHDGELVPLGDRLWASTLRLRVATTTVATDAEQNVHDELSRQLGPVLGQPTPK